VFVCLCRVKEQWAKNFSGFDRLIGTNGDLFDGQRDDETTPTDFYYSGVDSTLDRSTAESESEKKRRRDVITLLPYTYSEYFVAKTTLLVVYRNSASVQLSSTSLEMRSETILPVRSD
jgi:hypothetical protein